MNQSKIVFTGPGAVGKTATCIMYIRRKKSEAQQTTITLGANFYTKKIEKHNTTLQIWDLGGQSAFGRIRLNFYRGASAIVLMVDLSNNQTVNYAREIIDSEIIPYVKMHNVPCVFLVGNKIDLPTEIDDSILNDLSYYIRNSVNVQVPVYKICAFNIEHIDKLFNDIVNCVIHNESVN